MAWMTLLRRSAAALAAAASILLLPGCGGKSTDSTTTPAAGTVKVTVKVNYTRIPLVTDASGVPLGLDSNIANHKVLPARGVQALLWLAKDETNPDGTKTRIWTIHQASPTDSTGTINFTEVPKDTDAFVELSSKFQGSLGGVIRVVADPAGVRSSLPISERVIYSLRKGLDGSSPAGNPAPATKASADATVTFDVGLNDKWWLAHSNSAQILSANLESTGSGSRILAILDSAYSCQASDLGGVNPGTILDLHYRMGLSDSKGSFVEYDREKFPLSYDGSIQGFHFFGSLKGGSSNDDAFDEGVLFPLFFRNGLWAYGFASPGITGKALPDFLPDTALVEALPFAMAATLLKSPYLADTTPASTTNLDVRTLGSFTNGPMSGPSVSALAWDLTLKASSLPNPGTPADWAKVDPLVLGRFYKLTVPTDKSDRPNVYLQLTRLNEVKTAADPVDLAAIFTETVITGIATPYNITWPRPTSGPDAAYILDWGTDPNSLVTPLIPIALSMTKAVPVDGLYPNTSSGEAAFRRLSLTKDTAFNLRVTTVPASLPAGTLVQVQFYTPNTIGYTFAGSSTELTRVVFRGNKDTPIIHLVRVGILSPNNLAPDISVTIALEVAN